MIFDSFLFNIGIRDFCRRLGRGLQNVGDILSFVEESEVIGGISWKFQFWREKKRYRQSREGEDRLTLVKVLRRMQIRRARPLGVKGFDHLVNESKW